jgi:hypothetical protein
VIAGRGPAANLLRAVALAAAVFAQSTGSSLAEDLDEVMQVVKSGKCPDSLDKYSNVKTAEFCAYLNKPPCQNNDSDETCFLQLRDCWARVNQLNKEIFTYNQFMRKCGEDRAAAKAAAPAAVPTKIPTADAKKPVSKSRAAKAQKKTDDQASPN